MDDATKLEVVFQKILSLENENAQKDARLEKMEERIRQLELSVIESKTRLTFFAAAQTALSLAVGAVATYLGTKP